MAPVTLTSFTEGMTDAEQTGALWNEESPDGMVRLLNQHDFERGVIRGWSDETNVVIINLLQFEPGRNSNRWTAEAASNLFTSYGDGRFAALNNAKWVRLVAHANLYEMRTVFYKGDFAAVVLIQTTTTQTPDLLEAIATEQFNRLP
jgi:hypothetical protein